MNDVVRSTETIFGEAIEIHSPEDRRLFLDQACQGDDALRHAVEKLVNNHFRVGNFLEPPSRDLVSTDVLGPVEHAGMVIGAYKLVEQIGEGGFGVVFLAEQSAPVRRKVALKIIK